MSSCESKGRVNDCEYMKIIKSFMWTADKDVNMKATICTGISEVMGSWVQIPYRPEFFSGLIFTTAQVVFNIAEVAFIFMGEGCFVKRTRNL